MSLCNKSVSYLSFNRLLAPSVPSLPHHLRSSVEDIEFPAPSGRYFQTEGPFAFIGALIHSFFSV